METMELGTYTCNGSAVEFSPTCHDCAHFWSFLHRRCVAFERIPDAIWTGENDHSKPYPGDRGVLYQRVAAKQPLDNAA